MVCQHFLQLLSRHTKAVLTLCHYVALCLLKRPFSLDLLSCLFLAHLGQFEVEVLFDGFLLFEFSTELFHAFDFLVLVKQENLLISWQDTSAIFTVKAYAFFEFVFDLLDQG